jgi:predicted nucleotidyltransferase
MQPAQPKAPPFEDQAAPTQPADKTMRLTTDQVDAIKQTAKAVLGEGARVVLFGSRADDSKTGGDIDLLFETDARVANRTATIGALYVALIRQLGDRKIDVLLKDADTLPAPVLRIARQTGVEL